MHNLRGQSILLVVEGEVSPLISALQEAIEAAGAETLVVGDHPDTVADTLATFDFTAAVVNSEQQDVVSELKVPVVVFYEGDASEQIMARLRRVLV